jgi:hypothetical protein
VPVIVVIELVVWETLTVYTPAETYPVMVVPDAMTGYAVPVPAPVAVATKVSPTVGVIDAPQATHCAVVVPLVETIWYFVPATNEVAAIAVALVPLRTWFIATVPEPTADTVKVVPEIEPVKLEEVPAVTPIGILPLKFGKLKVVEPSPTPKVVLMMPYKTE